MAANKEFMPCVYVNIYLGIHTKPSICMYCSTWLGEGHQPHVQIKKLVSIRPIASTSRAGYVGRALVAAEQAMHRLFNEDR